MAPESKKRDVGGRGRGELTKKPNKKQNVALITFC